MELTRRRMCFAALAAALMPRRLLAAAAARWPDLRDRIFPGRVRPLDARKIRTRGRWAG